MPFALSGQTVKKETKKSVFFGKASYYDEYFNGRHTASGEIFSHKLLTAAHPSWPFNTRVRVTNLTNSNSVVVRINDRGPFIRGRHIDVSKQAAKILGFEKAGVVDVKMEILFWGDQSDSTYATTNTKSSPKAVAKKTDKASTKKSRIVADTTSLANNKPTSSKTKLNAQKPSKLKIVDNVNAHTKTNQKQDSIPLLAMITEPVASDIKTKSTDNLLLTNITCKTLSIKNSRTSDTTKPNNPTFAFAEKHTSQITETKNAKNTKSKAKNSSSNKNAFASDITTLNHRKLISAKTTSKNIGSKTSSTSKPIVTEKNVAKKNTEVKNEIMCTNSDSLSGWCVQVGCYGNRMNAQRTLDKVKETTQEWACIQVIHRNDLPFYRVICGKNIENKKASEIKQKLSVAYPDAFITNYTVLLNNGAVSKQ